MIVVNRFMKLPATIPILAVSRSSDFFYVNRHLIADTEEAKRMSRSSIKTSYDQKTGELQLHTAEGRQLKIRMLPKGIIRSTGRTRGFWHFKDYGEDRIVFEALEPYLVRLRDLEYRHAIGTWIRSLPVSIVKVYRGKGIYFTTQVGRSYAVAMPLSNTTYKVFVGLQTGVFVDPRRDGPAGTAQNFVHELGHLVDYAVISGGYGNYRQPHQFPEFRKTKPEKELIIGKGDDKVPQTPYGYVSRYAKANAQESFAEHFRAYILEKETFLDHALKEKSEGHPELMEKFRFMENLLEHTSTKMLRISSRYMALEVAWQESYKVLSRLYQTLKNLGDDAPASLTRLIDNRLTLAFSDSTAHEATAASYRKAFERVFRDVERIRDRKKRDMALAGLLGVTLDIEFEPDATTEHPGLTVTVRGADDGLVTGTITFDTRSSRRFGPVQPLTSIEVAARQTTQVTWNPETGEDHSAFIARAIANFIWRDRRFTLTKEATCRPTIPMWCTIGPFDNPGGATMDQPHPPETEPVDLARTYKGQGGKSLAWKKIRRNPKSKADAEFLVDFTNLLGEGEDAASYSVVWVHAPRKMDALFSFGSADGAVVWINREKKFSWLKGRRNYVSKANTIPIRLKKGTNELMVKVTVTCNSWQFSAHLTDTDGNPLEGIRYSLKR